MKIGVITRGKYGNRTIDTIKTKTDFYVISAKIPEYVPEFIEDPDLFIKNLNLNKEVFKVDLLITYSLHPDLNPEIVRMAAKSGVKTVIIIGTIAQVGSIEELKEIEKKYNIYLKIQEICCANKTLKEFTKKLGYPEFKIDTKGDVISKIEVISGSPCGSSWYMAEKLIGTSIKDAPCKAGLLVSLYPCRAVRGTIGGIHFSAEIHKKAVEDALNKIYSVGLQKKHG